MYVWVHACVISSDANTVERHCERYSVTNCRCDVGLSVRCFRLLSSKIDVFTFEDRCVSLRRSMCQPLKIDGRCVDIRGSIVDVSVDLR